MKKVSKLLLLFGVLLLSCICVSNVKVSAEEIGDFTIQDGVLKDYNGTDSEVSIPDNVTAIGSQAFYGNSNVKKVIMNDNVKELGSECFYNCKNLSEVQFSNEIEVYQWKRLFSVLP